MLSKECEIKYWFELFTDSFSISNAENLLAMEIFIRS